MIIGVTGHRDLQEECLSNYEKQVHDLLVILKREHSNVVIYSSLSYGADRLVVQEGIKLNIPFTVVLPMPKDKYILDFNNESLVEFESLLSKAKEVITIALHNGITLNGISSYSKQRDIQYEACGHYIADNCNNLFALWDGKYIGLTGGTGEIVKHYLKAESKNLHHIIVARK